MQTGNLMQAKPKRKKGDYDSSSFGVLYSRWILFAFVAGSLLMLAVLAIVFLVRSSITVPPSPPLSGSPVAQVVQVTEVPTRIPEQSRQPQPTVIARRLLSLDVMPDSSGVIVAGWDNGSTILEKRDFAVTDNLSGERFQYELDTPIIPDTVQISPAGNRFVLTSYSESMVLVFDVEQPTPLEVYRGMYTAAFSPDGEQLALGAATGGIRIIDMINDSLSDSLVMEHPVGNLVFSPDGEKLAASIFEDGQTYLRIFRVHALSDPPRDFPVDSYIHDMAFSPDSIEIAMALDYRVMLVNLSEASTRFWDTGQIGRIRSVAFSPDETWLAIAGGESATGIAGKIYVWRLPVPTPLPLDDDYYAYRILEGHDHDVNRIIFTAQPQRLISVSSDGSIRLWNYETGEELSRLQL